MPEKILNYTVSERIGVGGTGVVRRGRDAETKLDVAVKTLTADIAREAQTRKRLKNAKKSLATVPPHENLARALDIVEIGDTVHIIMEYAPGRSLETLLGKKTRPMPLESALPLFSQALRGAAAAHSKGVLHGNLKPTDILLSGDNQARVSGFGIASQIHLPSVVRAASRTGKLAYMSPEQIRGENPDERSDVYSLGAILYRLLTGKMPFLANERDAESRLRQTILQEPAPLIHETMPELNLSPYLSSVVERALAKDRRERIPTTREFIRLLQKAAPEILSASAVSATPAAVAAGVVAGSVVAARASAPTVVSSSASSPDSSTASSSSSSSGSSAATFAAGALAGAIAARLTGKSSAASADDSAHSAASASSAPTSGAASSSSTSPSSASPSSPISSSSSSPFSSSPSSSISPSSSPVSSARPTGAPPSSPVSGFVQPTLVRSAVEIENERRLQALRAQQAEQTAREERERAQAASDAGAQDVGVSGAFSSNPLGEGVSGERSPLQPSPEDLKTRFASAQADDKPAAEGRKEEKKRRAVLPWLIVGAAALGGGIYYLALKNTGSSSGDASQAQREISSDEIERRYDSLVARAEQAPLASDEKNTENNGATDGFADNNAANNDDKDKSGFASEQTSAAEEKPRIPDNAEEAKSSSQTPPKNSRELGASAPAPSPNPDPSNATKDREPSVVTKDASTKDALTKDASTKDALSKDASAPRKSATSAVAPSDAPASSPNAKRAQTATQQDAAKTQQSAANEKTAKTATSAILSKTTTNKSSAPTAAAASAPSTTKSASAAKRSTPQSASETRDGAKTPPNSLKSGSLAKASAESAAEREAARERVRQQYAAHLRKKATDGGAAASSASSSRSSAPTVSRSSSPVSPRSDKAVASSTPRTNREDSYAPERNPVSSVNALAPEAKELESASRKAKNLEPYLILRGHVGTVRSVTFSPDGKLIASGGDDKTVKIWDAATGTILRSLRGHLHSVTSVFFSPDGKTLMSGGKDKTVRVWDAATGEPLQSSPGVSCEGSPAAFSPDGKFLATSSARVITVTKMQP